MVHETKMIVFTGGPGTGKTALIEELKKVGIRCVDEIARKIIKNQMEINGDGVPWKDKELYKQIMLDESIESYQRQKIHKGEIIVFDRGIIDTFCYAKLINSEITQEMKRVSSRYRYYKKVFIFPPWKEIYRTDNERRQKWEEVLLTDKLMRKTYEENGYVLIDVPKLNVYKRLKFVLTELGIKKNTMPNKG